MTASVRLLLVGFIRPCGRDVASLIVGYAMDPPSEKDHDAYLRGDWDAIRDPLLYAAKYHSLLLLRWDRARLGEHAWTVGAGHTLALGGSLGLMRYACTKGCRFTSGSCLNAAGSGNLGALRWLRAIGVPWFGEPNGEVTQAVQNRDGDLLQWLIARGAPGHDTVCDRLMELNDLRGLEWAAQHGALPSAGHCGITALMGAFDIFAWLHTRGCPAAEAGSCQQMFPHVVVERLSVLFADRRCEVDPRAGLEEWSKWRGVFAHAVTTLTWRGMSAWLQEWSVADAPGGFDQMEERLAAGPPSTPEGWRELGAWLQERIGPHVSEVRAEAD